MVLEFPIMADYGVLASDTLQVYFTHGHLYNQEQPLPLQSGDVLLCGHFHVTACELQPDGWWYVNPGSVSIPKEDSTHQYLILEGSTFTWKDMDGTELKRETI